MVAQHHQVEDHSKVEGVGEQDQGQGHDDQWRVEQGHVVSERHHVENNEQLHVEGR